MTYSGVLQSDVTELN